MTLIYGALIFWSGCFVGFIAAAIFAFGRFERTHHDRHR
jgi:hypothetical protein